MNNMTTTRMLLSTAALAAVAALFAGAANAKMLDEGGSGGGAPTVRTVQPGMSAAVDNTLDPAIRQAIKDRAFGSGLTGDSALKVDRAVAAANEAYDTYRDKTAIAARAALFTDQQPSVGLTGDSALTRSSSPQPLWRSSAPQALTRSSAPESAGLTGDSALTRYPGTVTLPTASSASDGVDWSWFGLGAGMTALLAAGIAGVVLTTRHRGGIALP
jgi:hypothetical protein